MTVHEMRQRKAEAQREILRVLSALERETGCIVRHLALSRSDGSSLLTPREDGPLCGVRLLLEIP